MSSDYTFQPLGSDHDRAAFSCGNADLDDYLKTKARKELALGYCAAFVMIAPAEPRRICGYYTLSNFSVEFTSLTAEERKKFPKYPDVPTTLIGRMARSEHLKGTGCGEMLLTDALQKSYEASATIGSYAIVVDAIDVKAADFYKRYGFTTIEGDDRRHILPMKTVQKLFT